MTSRSAYLDYRIRRHPAGLRPALQHALEVVASGKTLLLDVIVNP
jgi:hypothetical protein